LGFAAAVVIAVLAELLIAWIEPPYHSFLAYSAVTDAVVAIGIAGEILLGTIWNNKIQTELRKRSNDKVAEAIELAAKASERTAILEKETVEAKLELQRLITPRSQRIIGENAEKIVAAILPFAGTKFDIGHAREGREHWDFLWVLEPLLVKAEWVFADWNPGPLPLPGRIRPGVFPKINWTMIPHTYGEANVSNVVLDLSPENRERLLPAANALACVLNEVGVAAMVPERLGPNRVSATADAIHILVGPKE
jgi:hypothetical protein